MLITTTMPNQLLCDKYSECRGQAYIIEVLNSKGLAEEREI